MSTDSAHKRCVDFVRSLLPSHKIVYHYCDATAAKGILTSDSIWATHCAYMNDSTEVRHGLDIFLEAINRRLESPGCPEKLRKTLKLVSEKVDGSSPTSTSSFQTYCCSFSDGSDRLSQWRGYAGNGQGYAFGLESPLLPQLRSPERGALIRVTYNDTEKRSIADKILDYWSDDNPMGSSAAGSDPISPEEGLISFILLLAPSFKDSGFVEEGEVRYIVTIPEEDSDDPNIVRLRERSGVLIPYLGLNNGSRLPISEIVIGPCHNYSNAKYSLSMLLRQSGYTDVVIKQSSVPFLP